MLTHKILESYLLTFPDVWCDYPFGDMSAVYKIGHKESGNSSAGKFFALIAEKSDPIRVSLKCSPELALSLREQYETVVPGYHLNKKQWNTIICTGQLDDKMIYDLCRLSYRLVSGSDPFVGDVD